METSILTSTKKILGLASSYTAFDLDIIIHINAAFSILTDLGVGPGTGFMIEDHETLWDSYDVPSDQLNLVKTYIFLKVKTLFDPPATSFHITAAENQLKEYEWRLNNKREVVRAINIPAPIIPSFDELDPPLSNQEFPDLDPPNAFQTTANPEEIIVQWNATDNVEHFIVWYRPADGSWINDSVLADEDSYTYPISTTEGVEYEIYVVSTASGYNSAATEHFFVTGI